MIEVGEDKIVCERALLPKTLRGIPVVVEKTSRGMQLGHILFGLLKAMRGRRKPAVETSGVCVVGPEPTPAVTISLSKRRWAIQLPGGRLFQVQAATKSEARARAKAMLREEQALTFAPQKITRLPVGTVAKRCLSQAA